MFSRETQRKGKENHEGTDYIEKHRESEKRGEKE